jgi:hypothetical protein
MKERAKNKRTIDYGGEVVFEKKPAPGFFDTGAEQVSTKTIGQEFRPITLEELEGKKRKVGGQGHVAWEPACRLLRASAGGGQGAPRQLVGRRVLEPWLQRSLAPRQQQHLRHVLRPRLCVGWPRPTGPLCAPLLCPTPHPPDTQDVEEALVKRDVKRQKVAEATDAPSAVAHAAHLNEVQMVKRRTRMMLPSPQVRPRPRALLRCAATPMCDDTLTLPLPPPARR